MDDFMDLAAARGTIAGVLRYGLDSFIDVGDLIDNEVFEGDDVNQAIWSCVEDIYQDGTDRKIDIPTLLATSKRLGVHGIIDKADSRKYLRSLFNYPIEQETVRHEAARLCRRRIAARADQMFAEQRRLLRKMDGSESLATLINRIEEPIFNFTAALNSGNNDGPQQIAAGIDEFLDNIENNPRDNIGIPSPFPVYNQAIGGGFRRATVSMIGARPKTGKSVTVDNIGLHVAGELGIHVLNVDTEMTREEHHARILAHLTGIGIKEIESGQYASDPDKKRAVREAAAWLKTIPYYYESVIDKSFDEQVAIMRRWVTRNVPIDEDGVRADALILYDYLQLNDPGEFGKGDFKEYQILGFQMMHLLRMAAKCDIAILSFLQLNRDGVDKESTAVAAGSDRIIWKCASFTILKKKDEQEIAEDGIEYGDRKLVPLISRHGEGLALGDYINIKFSGKNAKMVETLTRYQVRDAKGSMRLESGFETDIEDNTDIPFE